MSEKKWYAVYTRARCEKKVADLLTRKSIENYCPLNKVNRQWADRKKIIYEPLFTSYVFVRLTPAEHLQMIKTDGIVSFVYWLGKPAVIKDVEIDMIKRFLDEHMAITIEKTSVNVNDVVRIISGPLMEHAGQVIAVKSKTVKMLLPSLGYMMSAEIDIDKIEHVSNKLIQYAGFYNQVTMS